MRLAWFPWARVLLNTLLFRLVGGRGFLNNMLFRKNAASVWVACTPQCCHQLLNINLFRALGARKPLNNMLFRNTTCLNACCSVSLGRCSSERAVVRAVGRARVPEQHAVQGYCDPRVGFISMSVLPSAPERQFAQHAWHAQASEQHAVQEHLMPRYV